MSEELKHGIPKAICIGETKYTKEEREKHDRDFEKILKTYKILGENETREPPAHLYSKFLKFLDLQLLDLNQVEFYID